LSRSGAIGEKVRAIELVIAEKFVKRAVKAVAAGPGGNQHLAAHAKTVFCRVVIGDHLEFGYGVHGGLYRLRLKAERPAGSARAVVDPVQQDVGLESVLAERDEAALRSILAGRARPVSLRARRLHAERELSQLEVVAQVERHLHDALVLDH